MARIQILELPVEQAGEFYRTPFAIIIDQASSEEQTAIAASGPLFERFMDDVGASASIATAITLDIGAS